MSIHSSDGAIEHIFTGTSVGSISSLDDSVALHTPYFVAVDQRSGNIVASDWSSHDVKVSYLVKNIVEAFIKQDM